MRSQFIPISRIYSNQFAGTFPNFTLHNFSLAYREAYLLDLSSCFSSSSSAQNSENLILNNAYFPLNFLRRISAFHYTSCTLRPPARKESNYDVRKSSDDFSTSIEFDCIASNERGN